MATRMIDRVSPEGSAGLGMAKRSVVRMAIGSAVMSG